PAPRASTPSSPGTRTSRGSSAATASSISIRAAPARGASACRSRWRASRSMLAHSRPRSSRSMSDLATPLDRYRDVVRPEWIDHNQHMNVGYYLVVFDFATDEFMAWVGLDGAHRASRAITTFCLEAHVTYHREVRAGDPPRQPAALVVGAVGALEDAVERAAVDAEQLGRAHLVAARLVEDERDVPALELPQRHALGRQLRRAGILRADVRGQVLG